MVEDGSSGSARLPVRPSGCGPASPRSATLVVRGVHGSRNRSTAAPRCGPRPPEDSPGHRNCGVSGHRNPGSPSRRIAGSAEHLIVGAAARVRGERRLRVEPGGRDSSARTDARRREGGRPPIWDSWERSAVGVRLRRLWHRQPGALPALRVGIRHSRPGAAAGPQWSGSRGRAAASGVRSPPSGTAFVQDREVLGGGGKRWWAPASRRGGGGCDRVPGRRTGRGGAGGQPAR